MLINLLEKPFLGGLSNKENGENNMLYTMSKNATQMQEFYEMKQMLQEMASAIQVSLRDDYNKKVKMKDICITSFEVTNPELDGFKADFTVEVVTENDVKFSNEMKYDEGIIYEYKGNTWIEYENDNYTPIELLDSNSLNFIL